MNESLLSNLNADRVRQIENRRWIDSGELIDVAQPAMRDWLADTGWMTRRLRQLCADAFRFEVMHIGSTQLSRQEQQLLTTTDETAVCREIEFRLESEPLLFAQVMLTKETAQASQEWLHSLDVRPLGDELASRRDVERSDFRFTQINSNDPIYNPALRRASEMPETLWMRQSVFSVGNGALIVNEVFLPALWRIVARG